MSSSSSSSLPPGSGRLSSFSSGSRPASATHSISVFNPPTSPSALLPPSANFTPLRFSAIERSVLSHYSSSSVLSLASTTSTSKIKTTAKILTKNTSSKPAKLSQSSSFSVLPKTPARLPPSSPSNRLVPLDRSSSIQSNPTSPQSIIHRTLNASQSQHSLHSIPGSSSKVSHSLSRSLQSSKSVSSLPIQNIQTDTNSPFHPSIQSQEWYNEWERSHSADELRRHLNSLSISRTVANRGKSSAARVSELIAKEKKRELLEKKNAERVEMERKKRENGIEFDSEQGENGLPEASKGLEAATQAEREKARILMNMTESKSNSVKGSSHADNSSALASASAAAAFHHSLAELERMLDADRELLHAIDTDSDEDEESIDTDNPAANEWLHASIPSGFHYSKKFEALNRVKRSQYSKLKKKKREEERMREKARWERKKKEKRAEMERQWRSEGRYDEEEGMPDSLVELELERERIQEIKRKEEEIIARNEAINGLNNTGDAASNALISLDSSGKIKRRVDDIARNEPLEGGNANAEEEKTENEPLNPFVVQRWKAAKSANLLYEPLEPEWLSKRSDFQQFSHLKDTLIPLNSLEKPIEQRTIYDSEKIFRYFQTFPFFSTLLQYTNESTLHWLMKGIQLYYHEPGKELYKPGEIGSAFYLIIDGRVGEYFPASAQGNRLLKRRNSLFRANSTESPDSSVVVSRRSSLPRGASLPPEEESTELPGDAVVQSLSNQIQAQIHDLIHAHSRRNSVFTGTTTEHSDFALEEYRPSQPHIRRRASISRFSIDATIAAAAAAPLHSTKEYVNGQIFGARPSDLIHLNAEVSYDIEAHRPSPNRGKNLWKRVKSLLNLQRSFNLAEVLAMADSRTRLTTVKTLERTAYLSISYVEFERCTRHYIDRQAKFLLELFRSISFLRRFKQRKLMKLGKSVLKKQFAPGETIQLEGQPLNGIYFVVSGSISKWKTANSVQYHRVHTGNSKKADYLGVEAHRKLYKIQEKALLNADPSLALVFNEEALLGAANADYTIKVEESKVGDEASAGFRGEIGSKTGLDHPALAAIRTAAQNFLYDPVSTGAATYSSKSFAGATVFFLPRHAFLPLMNTFTLETLNEIVSGRRARAIHHLQRGISNREDKPIHTLRVNIIQPGVVNHGDGDGQSRGVGYSVESRRSSVSSDSSMLQQGNNSYYLLQSSHTPGNTARRLGYSMSSPSLPSMPGLGHSASAISLHSPHHGIHQHQHRASQASILSPIVAKSHAGTLSRNTSTASIGSKMSGFPHSMASHPSMESIHEKVQLRKPHLPLSSQHCPASEMTYIPTEGMNESQILERANSIDLEIAFAACNEFPETPATASKDDNQPQSLSLSLPSPS